MEIISTLTVITASMVLVSIDADMIVTKPSLNITQRTDFGKNLFGRTRHSEGWAMKRETV